MCGKLNIRSVLKDKNLLYLHSVCGWRTF